MASKKRKPEAVDSYALETERSLHQSFVQAANAVSQLYTSSLTGNKRAHVDGARQVLERQMSWVVREYGNAQSIPTAVLLSYLRQELQGVELAEMQCAAPAAAPCFSHTEHAHAERHCAGSAARRQAGLDGVAAFQPGGTYLPFGPAGFHPGAGR